MSLSFTLSSIFEILLVVAVFWGIFHEDKLIAFEKRLIAVIKRRKLKVVKAVPSRSSMYLYNSEN